jgi:PAS domain S-box-containing protein
MHSDFSTLAQTTRVLDYKAVFEASLSPYLVLSLDFMILAANEAYAKANRLKRNELMGRSIFDIYSTQSANVNLAVGHQLRISLERVLRDRTSDVMPIQKYNIPRCDSEGLEERFWIAVNKPVIDAAGNLHAIMHHVEDVTEFVHGRRRSTEWNVGSASGFQDLQAAHLELKLAKDNLERIIAQQNHELALSEERFRHMANIMPQIVWTARADGSLDWYNDCWYQYTGIRRDSHGQTAWDLVHPDDRDALKDSWNSALASGKHFEKDFRLKRQSDGEYRWHLSRAVPEWDSSGNVISWIGTSTDIHEQKKLADALGQAKSEAEEASRLKSVFLANMSHELRTPLTAITGFSQLLHEQNFSRDLEKRYLSVIDRNGRQLLRIIDDILDLSKVEAGKLTIERMRLPLLEIVSDLRNFLELKAQSAGLSHSVEILGHVPETIETDPTRLKQILMNLISNAVKFTKQGAVQIRLGYRSEPQQIYFEVTDTGRGVTQEQAQFLFEPFVQADSSITRTYGGTGLGLTLSRLLARALGGDVELLSSTENQGSTFIAWVDPGSLSGIPLVNNNAIKREVARQQHQALLEKYTGALKGRKILLVDDADDNRALISAILHRTDATLVTARDGIECLDYAAAEEFDLTLMDMQMPRMDGFEATKILRQSGYSKPIVALTAHAMREQIQRCHEAGCTAHLSKPVNHGELIATVVKLME